MTDIQQVRRVREVKALSGVVAALSLPIYGSAAFFGAWDARFVSFYVGSVVMTIAIGLQIYVRRPAAFGVHEIGDSLRTQYARPSSATAAITSPPVAHLTGSAAVSSPARATRRDVVRQCSITVALVATYAVCVTATTWVLAGAPGWTFFAAAMVILAIAFWIGRGFAVGASGAAAVPTTTRPSGDDALSTSTTPAPHAA